MNTGMIVLRRRQQLEQRTILILRRLAGTGDDRVRARAEIMAAGGTGATIIPLARLVGTAVVLGLDIRAPDAPYVSGDELVLLSHLTEGQLFAGHGGETMDKGLSTALSEAAMALDSISLISPA